MLIIRADASVDIGTGHIMRCLALAQAWQAVGGTAVFAVHSCPDALATRLRREGVEVEYVAAVPGTDADAVETAALARRLRAEWVVVDGYGFGTDYQAVLREVNLRVLFIDDNGHAERYTADLILNQNAYATASLYANRADHTRLLLGLRYLLLRREFWSWGGWERLVVPRARRVLVTLGGADAANVTGRVLQALDRLNDADWEAVVLVGAGNQHAETIREHAADDARIRIQHNVTDMPVLMTWAEVGVTAGGSTCYEAARFGLPCVTIILAENQRPVAESLAANCVIKNLGWHEALSPEAISTAVGELIADPARRALMAEAGQALVPGGGAQRVVHAMTHRPSDAVRGPSDRMSSATP